jgi:hypothetical protein
MIKPLRQDTTDYTASLFASAAEQERNNQSPKKRACLQSGIRKPDHNRVKLGLVILE